MKNQIEGYRKLADEMLNIAFIIEQALAVGEPKEAYRMIENARGRVIAFHTLFNEQANAITEAEDHRTVKH